MAESTITIEQFLQLPSVTSGDMLSCDQEREQHLLAALRLVTLPGQVVECGVYKGNTINLIAEHFANDTVWGFDSFEGLPEAWFLKKGSTSTKWPKGAFSIGSQFPLVRDNVQLVKGWFSETLQSWAELHPSQIKFLHVDCDLYASTVDVLTTLSAQIVPGTVIVFDELFHWGSPQVYSNWEAGEWKALMEWASQFDRRFVPATRNRYMQCAVVVTK